MGVEHVLIPDFGGVQQITVVEIFVSPGTTVKEDDSLLTLESEKAVMDLPSPFSGVVEEVLVEEDEVVKSGRAVVAIRVAGNGTAEGENEKEKSADKVTTADPVPEKTMADESGESGRGQGTGGAAGLPATGEAGGESVAKRGVHATPSVRALARRKGVELDQVHGTGPGGRIVKEDVLQAVAGEGGAAENKRQRPPRFIDEFAGFGEVEEVALSRIQKIGGSRLEKSWTEIPHVTHFEEADVTDLEKFRQQQNESLSGENVRLSLLAFVIKAVAASLKQFPLFNSSLLPESDKIVLKRYWNIGIAVDTPDGLVVPVIKRVDTRGIYEIAEELIRVSGGAREQKLAINDMQGATFTISSLGGIGGTGFTPIISMPQVAILGISRTYMKPVWDGQRFVPRRMLPFSVSYDHRVIDGAEAARFCISIKMNVEDLKRTLL